MNTLILSDEELLKIRREVLSEKDGEKITKIKGYEYLMVIANLMSIYKVNIIEANTIYKENEKYQLLNENSF